MVGVTPAGLTIYIKMSPPCDMCISKPNVGSSDSLVIETLKRKTRDGELNSSMFET